jgi:deoxyadenosine/deoxycytidine kinase
MKSLVFAATTLKGDEYNLYRQIFYIIYSSLPKPDIFVYLHVSTDRLLDNIARRGRSFEKSITKDYLEKIQENYFAFFRQNPDNKYLIIDVNNIDFVENNRNYEKIRDLILVKDYLPGMTKLIL